MTKNTINKVDGFQYTTAIKKLRKLKKRIRVIPGGTGAGKTGGIIPIIIDDCAKHPFTEASIVSETIPHIRKGALKDFLNVMRSTGRFIKTNYNKTLLTYTFENGSFIEFFSVDQEDKVRGPRRHIIYINECNRISFETYHQLAIRTNRVIWLDFNPSNRFWVHSELLNDHRTEWLTLTYKDNEALPESIVEDIELSKEKAYHNPDLSEPELSNSNNIKSSYWANWWLVYGLGQIGSLEGGVFSDKLKSVKEVPEYATFISYGMDYSNSGENNSSADPHSIQELWFADGCLYIKKIYEGNCNITNQELTTDDEGNQGYQILLNDEFTDIYSILYSKCPELNKKHEYGIGACIADSANGANTNKLRSLGMNVIGYREFIKQNNLPNYSKVEAIKNLRSFDKICIVEGGESMLKQFEELQWSKDKEGKIITDKIDWTSVHHSIDGVIYGSMAFSWS
jgi:phage terminase large subunit